MNISKIEEKINKLNETEFNNALYFKWSKRNKQSITNLLSFDRKIDKILLIQLEWRECARNTRTVQEKKKRHLHIYQYRDMRCRNTCKHHSNT